MYPGGGLPTEESAYRGLHPGGLPTGGSAYWGVLHPGGLPPEGSVSGGLGTPPPRTRKAGRMHPTGILFC